MAGIDDVRWRNLCVGLNQRQKLKVPNHAELPRDSQIRSFFLSSSRLSSIPAVTFRMICKMATTPVLSVSWSQRLLNWSLVYSAASITPEKGKIWPILCDAVERYTVVGRYLGHQNSVTTR